MTENPYAPPSTTEDPQILEPGDLPLASLGQRFAASILDSLIVYGPLLLVSIFATVPFLNDLYAAEDLLSQAIFALIAFFLFLAVNFSLIHIRDQTIGKAALGIKVTTLSGESPSTANQAGIRYAFYHLVVAIPFVGTILSLLDALFIFGRERRCLHDLLAGTRVVVAR